MQAHFAPRLIERQVDAAEYESNILQNVMVSAMQ